MNKPHNTPHILRGSLKGEHLRMRMCLMQIEQTLILRRPPLGGPRRMKWVRVKMMQTPDSGH